MERFGHHVVRLGHVAVIAMVDEQERVLMLRRYRFIPGRSAWELPGGMVELGEEPADAACREAEEETGWRPRVVQRVVTFQPMIGMVDSPHDVFVGWGAVKVGTPTDPEEAGPVEWIPVNELPGLLARGELAGAGTLVAVLHVMAGLSRRPSSS
ncbi:NUDIX hydrolase [Micromonospora yangpuensis]|nr:NUDIX hydrolase [Micromonospora yangpuensis]